MAGKQNSHRKRYRIGSRGRRALALTAAGIFLVGLLTRHLGLRLGLPYIHHWDECWIIWNTQRMLDARAPVSMTFQYGAPLSALAAWCVKVNNLWPGAVPIAAADEIKLRWIARGVSVVISATGTLAMVVAGRNMTLPVASRSRLGLYAGATYAVAYELVTHARYGVTDASLAALAAWSLAFGAVFLRTRRLLWILLSLAFATLAFGFKFTALPTVAIPVLCLIAVARPIEGRPSWVRSSLIVGGPLIALAGFVLVNPHFVDSFQQAVGDLAARMAQTRDGGFSRCYVHEPGIDHLRHLLWALAGHTLSRSVPLSCVLSAVSVLGIGWAVNHWSKIMLVGTIHAMIVVVGLAVSVRTLVLRNYLTAVPLLCLGVGIALERFHTWVLRRRVVGALRHLALLPVALLFVLTFLTLRDSVANARLSDDSRVRAIKWVTEHARAGSSLLLSPSVLTSMGGIPSRQILALTGPNVSRVFPGRTCADVVLGKPEYVIVASYRGPDTGTVDFDERWDFTECPGYRRVASFEPNPYECTFWHYPTWMGRVSAVVMARAQ